MTVAGAGDGAGAAPRSRGVFAWNQSEETHQLSGIVEAGDVTPFGQDGHRTEYIDAAQADEGVYHRCEGPGPIFNKICSENDKIRGFSRSGGLFYALKSVY